MQYKLLYYAVKLSITLLNNAADNAIQIII